MIQNSNYDGHLKIDIIIVDYNAGDMIRDCLNSLCAYPPQCVTIGQISVVDNNSVVPSERYLPECKLPVRYIRNSENLGFAVACNLGAASSTADYLLFLNPDTRLMPNSIDAPIEFMERPKSQSIGIISVQLLDEMGRVSRTCSYFPKVTHFINKSLGLDYLFPNYFSSGKMTNWDHLTSRHVDIVIGAFFLVRRELFDLLGGFDERFFVYFEEVDFSYRAACSGYDSYYLADVEAYHKGQGTSDSVRAKRIFYSWHSRLCYVFKHFSLPKASVVFILTVFFEPLSRILLSISQRSWQGVMELCQGYLFLWMNFMRTFFIKNQKQSKRDIP